MNLYKKEYRKEEIEYFVKFKVNVLFMHTDDITLEEKYLNFEWIKDRGVINTAFIKSDMQDPSVTKRVRFLVLQPNGEYFISNYHFNDNTKILKTLLKNKDWSECKEDHKKSLYGNIMGKGLFKRKPKYSYEQHCF
ncbi:hypothetical protein [Mesonia sp.]|uniref:hypothetical protein n=1 Tax=Mesonia sp. TaxID=1960830 RepID=UPI003F99DA03